MENNYMHVLSSLLKKFFKRNILPPYGYVVKDVGGFKMKLDFNEYIDSSIVKNEFEVSTVNAFRKYCKPGYCVFDIGANVGYYSFLSAKLVGKNGVVYAFEPTEYAYSKLVVNKSLNNFENIVLNKIALSDVCGVDQLLFNSSWQLNNAQNVNIKEKILLETIDAYVQRIGIKKIDFIKIDVDGFEYKILKGAQNTLEHYKPIIIVELCGYTLLNNGSSLRQLVELIRGLGYNFFNEKTFLKYSFEQIEKDIIENSILLTSSMNVILSKSKKI